MRLSDLNFTLDGVQHSFVIDLKIHDPSVLRILDERWFFVKLENINTALLNKI